MMVKMMATFRVFYNLQIRMPTNGRQMVGIDVNSKNSVFRQMEQMDDKWTTNGRKQCFGTDLAGKDKWESVCLNIRSHLSSA